MARISGAQKSSDRPVPVSAIVDRLIRSLGLSNRYYGWLIAAKWPEIVGEYYARKSEAIRFDDGTLYIAVEDASWRQMMQLDRDKILRIIHGYPHGRVVKDIRTVWGKKGY